MHKIDNDKDNIWQKLKDYYDDDRINYYGGCVEDDEIKDAELKLGLKFDDSYKKFIKLYGSGTLPSYSIYGSRFQDDMEGQIWSVIHNTLFYKIKQKWSGIDDWYIISDNGFGSPIGIKPNGEVWLSDHDSIIDGKFEQLLLAKNFEEFLYKLLTETLYE